MAVQVNIALVLAELKDRLATAVPDLKYIFDHSLTYDTATKKLRATNELTSVVSDAGERPLFVCNRSPLKHREDIGRRINVISNKKDIPNLTTELVKSTYAMFDLRFLIIAPNIRRLEQLEVEYLAEEGVTSIRKLTLNIPALTPNNFSFGVTWEELEDFQIESENSFYNVLSGSAIVQGPFLMITGSGDLIGQIDAEIRGFDAEVLTDNPLFSTITIIPPP